MEVSLEVEAGLGGEAGVMFECLVEIGSVHLAAQLLYDDIGDLAVLDIGGATTDVHSVTDGSPEVMSMMTAPEPKAKRTVEGDIGMRYSIRGIIEAAGLKKFSACRSACSRQ